MAALDEKVTESQKLFNFIQWGTRMSVPKFDGDLPNTY